MLWVYENWITNQNGVRGHDGEASEEETAKAHVFFNYRRDWKLFENLNLT